MNIRTFFLSFGVVSCIVVGLWQPVCRAKSRKKQSEAIEFSYNKQELRVILQDIARRKGYNLLFQQADGFNATVTFTSPEKLSIEQAWNLVLGFTNDAGYQIVPAGKNLYKVMPEKNVYRETIPVYINPSYTELPDSAQVIRVMHYFQNLDGIKDPNNQQLNTLIQSIVGSKSANQGLMWDTTGNGVAFVGQARLIKQVLQLLDIFDEAGYKQEIDLLTLKYAQSGEVKKLLDSLIVGKGSGNPGPGKKFIGKLGSDKQVALFSKEVRILELDPQGKFNNNTLVFLGKPEHIQKIIEFIQKYIDIPQQEGKSLFHVIDIHWQKASDLVSVLNSIVKSTQTSKSGQSQSSLDLSDLAFDPNIKIVAEKTTSEQTGGDKKGTVQYGGNRLIVTANERDWQRIERIIKILDVPKKQVVIEAMILDLSVIFQRNLAAQLRTRGLTPQAFPKDIQAQAATFTDAILADNNTSLLGDFISLFDSSNGAAAQSLSEGGTALVYGNGARSHGIWAFFQMIASHKNAKTLSKPFTVAQNNETAHTESSVTRRTAGKAVGKVAAQINYEDVEATTKVDFTPLVSKDNLINLQIDINIEQFLNATSGADKATREVTNNVFLKSGDVMIMGGLTQENLVENQNRVPFLASIPIVGNLFSSKTKTTTKTQLFVIVRATVIEPRTQGGMGHFTRSAFREINAELTAYDDLFVNLKDPVSRWFFGGKSMGDSGITQDFDMSVSELLTTAEAQTPSEQDAPYKTEQQIDTENLPKTESIEEAFNAGSSVTQSIQEQRRRPGLQTFIQPVTQTS